MYADNGMSDREWDRYLNRPVLEYDAGFFAWICARKAHDNPRGDFVRDTRDMMPRKGIVDESRINTRLYAACDEAREAFYRLADEYQRATGTKLPTLREALAADDEERRERTRQNPGTCARCERRTRLLTSPFCDVCDADPDSVKIVLKRLEAEGHVIDWDSPYCGLGVHVPPETVR